MKKYLTLILAVVMAFFVSFSVIANETEASSNDVLDEMRTEISAFEEAHPELKDQFHLVIKDATVIASEEFREAFTNIQNQFAQMLEEDGKQMDIPEEVQEDKRQTLQTQAALLNANFLAHLKDSEERLIASLRGMEYPEGKTDVIKKLKEISEGMEGNENASELKDGRKRIR